MITALKKLITIVASEACCVAFMSDRTVVSFLPLFWTGKIIYGLGHDDAIQICANHNQDKLYVVQVLSIDTTRNGLNSFVIFWVKAVDCEG